MFIYLIGYRLKKIRQSTNSFGNSTLTGLAIALSKVTMMIFLESKVLPVLEENSRLLGRRRDNSCFV